MGSCVSTEAPPAPVYLDSLAKPNFRLPVGHDTSCASSASGKDLCSAASSTDSTYSTNRVITTQSNGLALKYTALWSPDSPLGSSPRSTVAADVTLRTFSTPLSTTTLRQAAESAAALRHNHIASVLGYCADPPCMVVEHCPRGSLADILAAARDDPAAAVELTWARRLCLLGDIAAGMAYLHGRSPQVVHGNLMASNCLIDGAGVVKIADIATPDGAGNTPAADLLAFGLIMREVLTWESGINNLEPVTVESDCDGPEVMRLALPKLATFPGQPPASERSLARYLSLMEKCMHPECVNKANPECSIDFVRVLRELTGLEFSER